MSVNIAVIPARGGSKRVPGKNIRPFHGRPILHYPIAAALESGLFDHVLVSTDSERIAEVARQGGAETPFMRPPELADDHATTVAVLLHAAQWYEDHGEPVSTVCCLYPAAVFVGPALIRRGYDALRAGATSACTVVRYDQPIQRALTLDEEGRLRMMWPEFEITRTQDLAVAFRDAGQMYWLEAGAMREERRLYTAQAAPLEMDDERVQDIDTEADWTLAEAKFAAMRDGGR